MLTAWTEEFIDEEINAAANNRLGGTYNALGDESTTLVREVFSRLKGMVGSTGLVIGSEHAWVEALALHAGAERVITMDYANLHSQHPKLTAQLPLEVAEDWLQGKLPSLNWVVTYSSIEHSGLGRYGDRLNPDGDRDAVRQVSCLLEPGGWLAIGFAMSCRNHGWIEFNAHRVYGYERLAYISQGFELIGFVRPCRPWSAKTFYPQPVFVLRKPNAGVMPPPLTAADFSDARTLDAVLAAGVQRHDAGFGGLPSHSALLRSAR